MEKEYPFQGMSFEEIIEITFEESARAILARGEGFSIGFSLYQDGAWKNFVSPLVTTPEKFKPTLKKMQGISKQLKDESRVTSSAWFIDEPAALEKLNPNHTTRFQ